MKGLLNNKKLLISIIFSIIVIYFTSEVSSHMPKKSNMDKLKDKKEKGSCNGHSGHSHAHSHSHSKIK